MFRNWQLWETCPRTHGAVQRQRGPRYHPVLELLEERALLSFLPAVNYPIGPPAAPISVAVGDLRANGTLDLVTDNINTNTVSVLLGNGDGTFQAPVQYAVDHNSWQVVALGDVNGDGKLDIVVAGSTTSVLLGNGDGTFQPAITTSFGAALGQLVDFKLADVNGDGKLDIVAVNSFGSQPVLTIALGNGDGTFRQPYSYNAPGFIPNSIAVADFNGDGNPDVAIASKETFFNPETGEFETTGAVTIFLGTGGGFFGAPRSINPVPGAGSILVGDFNGDGILDLLTVNSTADHHDSISVMFGNGDGTFQQPVFTPRPEGGLGASVAADFNGDGILDVAAVSLSTNSVSVFLGKGDGTFQAPQSFAVDKNPLGLGVSDFNGDGFPDLATANFASSSRDVSVLINAADSALGPRTAGRALARASIPATGSFLVTLPNLALIGLPGAPAPGTGADTSPLVPIAVQNLDEAISSLEGDGQVVAFSASRQETNLGLDDQRGEMEQPSPHRTQPWICSNPERLDSSSGGSGTASGSVSPSSPSELSSSVNSSAEKPVGANRKGARRVVARSSGEPRRTGGHSQRAF
jgi:FG-GAP-like repeat/FG-GAP repeat